MCIFSYGYRVLSKEEVILLLHGARNEMEKAMIALAVGAGAISDILTNSVFSTGRLGR